MPQLSLSFELGNLALQRAEDACFDCGALAVTLSDCRDDAVLEPLPGEVRIWPATRVQALFAAEAAAPVLVGQLADTLQLPVAAIAVSTIPDKAWEREWLRDFHAMRFGRRLWVCPSHERVADAGAVIVELDPGLAFGTGTHPSTALCLEWLDSLPEMPAHVIDYGCGSGILGVAAAKLGADEVQAFDIDAQALLATHENALRNGVSDRMRIVPTAAEIQPGAGLLLANILAGTLIELTAELCSLLRPGGRFVLAGILAEQQEDVLQAFAHWSDVALFRQSGDWIALTGTRTR